MECAQDNSVSRGKYKLCLLAELATATGCLRRGVLQYVFEIERLVPDLSVVRDTLSPLLGFDLVASPEKEVDNGHTEPSDELHGQTDRISQDKAEYISTDPSWLEDGGTNRGAV